MISSEDVVKMKKKKWLTAEEWMKIISEKTYSESLEIGLNELQKLKEEGTLTIRVPKESNGKIPFDTITWSKTVRSLKIRHEPRYCMMKLFDSDVQTVRCLRYESEDISKQFLQVYFWVFTYDDYIYSHYVILTNECELPDSSNSNKRRLNTHQIDILRNDVMPNETIVNAKRVAHERGINVTTKQLLNLNRKDRTADIDPRGPRGDIVKLIESIRAVQTDEEL
ncbi:hypothetical protein L5515_009181 [Caenorhabditis briggsae]|uniref:Uncharacterized protein n=1 Tax=Caenorhabditis briggsae TaxID=6238 RepID=A0AAE9F871_CAEBR|nr:hypothetical protein L5515_009181 [Caenorhabditis briggsae]